jgi:MipA family protein
MTARTNCYAIGAAITLGLSAAVAQAQDTRPRGVELGLALGAAPDYLGSDEYEAVPLPSLSITTDRFTFRNNGLGVEVDVARAFGGGTGVIGYGPILRYDAGRNDGGKVKDAVVALMAPVKASVEAGGFIEATLPMQASQGSNPTLLNARLSLVQGLNGGHEGLLAEASLGVIKPLGRWTIGGGLTLAAGDGDYTNANFGVSAADAAATGLDPYRAGGGLRDAGLSVFTSYAVNDRLSVDLVAGYSKLLGDAADSPVVADRGSDEQGFVGLGLTWRFE